MSDLISRQAVLEATSAKIKITGKENAETVYKYIKKLCDDIKALPSAQQWIPCSERLPEESGDYLVTVAHHSGELWVEVDQFDNENGSWWHYMNDVTAWMPLPEPYKGEES